MIGDQIRALRIQRQWSQAELARRSGVSQPQISRLESREQLTAWPDTCQKLAEALGVPLSTILGRPIPGEPHQPGANRPDQIKVPMVQVPAHAGDDWTWSRTGESVDVDPADAAGRRLIALTIRGTCMDPELHDGDIVLVDIWSRQPKDREMVAVSDGGQILVRWARVAPSGQITLVTENGTTLRGATLEGVVYRILRTRPRRRDWHDLIE